jgi:energy-coupling factor transport system substrate-specific component
MSIVMIYLLIVAIGVALAVIAYFMNRDTGGKIFVAFTLLEIVIMAIIGVINGVLGTPNAMLGRLFMTFSGSYGFLAFAAICGGFYVSGPLCGYIIRKPGAATIAETMNGVAQVLSGNPNGIMVLAAGFLQGFMSDIGFAFYGYKRWTLSAIALSGALAPLLQQIPEVYFFGVGDMGISYNLLALIIRMASGAVYAIVLVKPIAHALAKAGVLRGTAVAKEEADARVSGQMKTVRG